MYLKNEGKKCVTGLALVFSSCEWFTRGVELRPVNSSITPSVVRPHSRDHLHVVKAWIGNRNCLSAKSTFPSLVLMPDQKDLITSILRFSVEDYKQLTGWPNLDSILPDGCFDVSNLQIVAYLISHLCWSKILDWRQVANIAQYQPEKVK